MRLLGPVEALADGQALPLGGPRQRALLALLALQPGRSMPAAAVAEELWHGRPPVGAENTLRTYVSRLRQALGRDAVVSQSGGYSLILDAERLDVCRFERLVREGRDALARGAAGLAAERISAALELWRGRALADVSEGGTLASEALRLDELRVAALEDRIDADLALARHAELVPELRALVQQQPLRERLWRQLVLALYRSGQQADALAAYRDARALLDRELGLEPTPELQELERAILRHEVENVEAADARHNLPASLAGIVGRERELRPRTVASRPPPGHRHRSRGYRQDTAGSRNRATPGRHVVRGRLARGSHRACRRRARARRDRGRPGRAERPR